MINQFSTASVRELHKAAMEFEDLGKIYKIKGDPTYFSDYMMLAFILDREAAWGIQNSEETNIRKVLYPRSAGWLAYKIGRFEEAIEMANLGLKNKDLVDGYEISKIEDLLEKAKIGLKNRTKNTTNESEKITFSGSFIIANFKENKIAVESSETGKSYEISVPSKIINDIARFFSGAKVLVVAAKNDGEMILEDIRSAA